MIGKEIEIRLKYESYVLHCELIVSDLEPEVGYQGAFEVQRIVCLDKIENVYDFIHEIGSVEDLHEKIKEQLLKTK